MRTDGNPDVDCLILAGGLGERLHPLTLTTPKPLLRFAAVHALIDFTLANVRHSGIHVAYVLSQYRSAELGRHLRGCVPTSSGGTILNQPPVSGKRYRGTADAVAQNLEVIESESDLALVLAADHVYRMDYRKLIAYAERRSFGVTVACIPVPAGEVSRFGIAWADGDGCIRSFEEKPAALASDPRRQSALASMGVYVFRKEILRYALRELNTVPRLDFGRHVLPFLAHLGLAGAYDVTEEGDLTFWRDVGTLVGYHRAHMEVLDSPLFSGEVLDASWLIPWGEPSLHVRSGKPSPASDSIVAASAVLGDCRLGRSVVAPEVVVEDGAEIEDCVLLQGAQVGRAARMRGAILDAGARVNAGDRLAAGPGGVLIVSDRWGTTSIPAEIRCATRATLVH
jgi:glucose-1-phosphate adenylyltransferase